MRIEDENMKSETLDPDWSPGEIIAAYSNGTVVLDDGLTTWNPLRAEAFLLKENTKSPYEIPSGCVIDGEFVWNEKKLESLLSKTDSLSQDDLNTLRRGDIVRHASGNSYVVITDAVEGRPAVAVREITIENPAEWTRLWRNSIHGSKDA